MFPDSDAEYQEEVNPNDALPLPPRVEDIGVGSHKLTTVCKGCCAYCRFVCKASHRLTLFLSIPWQVETMVSEWLEELTDIRVQFVYGLRKLADFGDTVSVGSICTGWGVGDMVVDAVNKVVQSRNVHLHGRVPGSYPKAGWVQ